jgi:single-strand DNA-binding protein
MNTSASRAPAFKHINEVRLGGVLAQAPTKRLTSTGNAMATGSLCVAATAKSRSYVRFVAFENQAELIAGLHEGDFLEIKGRIQSRTWQKDDGQKQYVTEIVVGDVVVPDGVSNTTLEASDNDLTW